MTIPPSSSARSKCCNATIIMMEGNEVMKLERAEERGHTFWMLCSSCNKPCDLSAERGDKLSRSSQDDVLPSPLLSSKSPSSSETPCKNKTLCGDFCVGKCQCLGCTEPMTYKCDCRDPSSEMEKRCTNDNLCGECEECKILKGIFPETVLRKLDMIIREMEKINAGNPIEFDIDMPKVCSYFPEIITCIRSLQAKNATLEKEKEIMEKCLNMMEFDATKFPLTIDASYITSTINQMHSFLDPSSYV